MIYSTTSVLGAMLAMAPLTAHAHMIMSNPVPYGGVPDKAPLIATGDNFPCQAVPYTVNKMNDWPVGSNQSVVFVGTAVHNGGSCQVSVTLDKAPTKASKWKVIHSFEGGCPFPPKEGGNYVEGGPGPPPISFLIPPELPNGEFSMSWSWQNKVGSREFYQNCAPVKVSGGAKDNTAFDALPDMAVANIAGVNTCHTTEGFDYTYENPGKYVTKGGKGPFMPLCGGASTPGTPPPPPGGAPIAPGAPVNPGIPSPAAPAPGTPSGASGNMGASSQAPVAPVAPSQSQAVAPPAAGNAGAQTSTLRTIITVTAPMGPPPAGATPAPQVPVPSSQAASNPAQASAISPQSPASPSQAPAAPGAASGQTCSPDGSILCSADGTHFGLCNFGKAVMQPVAGGTKCQGGKIGRRQDAASTLRTVYA